MKVRSALFALAALAVVGGLGGWLWLRNGVPVWLEGAVAFCF